MQDRTETYKQILEDRKQLEPIAEKLINKLSIEDRLILIEYLGLEAKAEIEQGAWKELYTENKKDIIIKDLYLLDNILRLIGDAKILK